MSSNEYTSKRIAEIASRVLRGEKCTEEEYLALAASALTQARDKQDFTKESEKDLADD